MKSFILRSNHKPSDETLQRLSELKDEDIVYDEDSPMLTPEMRNSVMTTKATTYTIKDLEKLPEGSRAELISGKIYMMDSPSRLHQGIVSGVLTAINNYIRENKESFEAYPAPFAVRLNADDSTYLEPDISVICDTSKLDDNGCNGAPDWIIEVTSPTSIEQDYYRKLMLYLSAGVQEYWVINPMEEKVNVYSSQFRIYSFEEDIPVGINPGMHLRIKNLI